MLLADISLITVIPVVIVIMIVMAVCICACARWRRTSQAQQYRQTVNLQALPAGEATPVFFNSD